MQVTKKKKKEGWRRGRCFDNFLSWFQIDRNYGWNLMSNKPRLATVFLHQRHHFPTIGPNFSAKFAIIYRPNDGPSCNKFTLRK